MATYVIGPDVALRLAREKAVIAGKHRLLAPTLMRSQLLSLLASAATSMVAIEPYATLDPS